MADKKDLSEAQSYSRRRLVTAFTSGIPDGVELHPVINAISARLLIPSSDFKVLTVADDQLKGIPIGSTIGILGAPDSLPDRDNLITGSIRSCTSEHGLDTTVSNANTKKQTSREAIVASVDGIDYLVTGSHRYQLPSEPTPRDAYLRALGIPQTAVITATTQWINLFEQGDAMEPIALHNEGEIIGVHGVDVTVGGVVQQQGDARQTRYVVMPDGSLSALSDFTYGLYIIGKPERLTQPRTLSATDFQYFSNSATSVIPDTWPVDALVSTQGRSSACAVYPLHSSGKATPSHAQLAVTGDYGASTDGSHSDSVTMRDGAGALVRAAIGTSDKGTVFAIDSTGTAYPVPEASEEILKRLGYSGNDVRTIPRAWIDVADGQEQCQAGVENYITQRPWTNDLFDPDTLHQQSTGKGVTVAVIDSGVDVDNPHLKDAVVPGVSYLQEDPTNGTTDTYSHGTAVAGIIAARNVQDSHRRPPFYRSGYSRTSVRKMVGKRAHHPWKRSVRP